MNCERFEERLDDFLGGRLSDVERRAAESHRASCSRCDALATTLGETLGALGPDALLSPGGTPAPDLAGAIVERTSGAACGRAQALLCDLVDAVLPPADAQLVGEHLAHCNRCTALHRTLVWLQIQLPRMASVEPDSALVGEIVRATSGQHVRRVPLRHHVRDWWRGLAARPRFAFEVAYVGTLVLVLLFGTSASPFRSVPSRALAVIQVDPRHALGSAAGELRALHSGIGAAGTRAWEATGEQVLDRGRAASATYAGRHPGMNEAWDGFQAHSSELRQHMAQRNFAGISLVLQALGRDAGALWTSMTASQPAPPSQ